MNKVKLGDIADYSDTRIDCSSLSIENYVGTDNIKQDKQGKDNSQYTPNSGFTTEYTKNDILIANIRPYLKKIWFATNDGGSSADVLTIRVKSKKYLPKFVYYSLFQDSFFDYAIKGAKGSKMPRGDKKQILNFLISDFDLPTQTAIARILSSLDDKIELNNKINRELENLAKTIYEYWFVQNAEESWEKGELSEIANITMGQSPDGSSYNENGDGITFYQGCTDFGVRFPTVRQYTTAPTRFAEIGDILLSVRAPVGSLNFANTQCCIGRGLAALNSKMGSITHLYFILKDLQMVFKRRNTDGTTFGAITKDDLFSLSVTKPPKDVLMKFEKIANPIFEKQFEIAKESVHLAQLRDFLLPLLMNGQVAVGKKHTDDTDLTDKHR